MRYLLDTNVVSELRKKVPNEGVKKFVLNAAASQIYISCLTIGEIKIGIFKLQKKDKIAAASIEKWLGLLMYEYSDRILGIDLETAEEWAKLTSSDTNHVVDNLIAAQALQNNMTLVTRNIKDYRVANLKLLNPFT